MITKELKDFTFIWDNGLDIESKTSDLRGIVLDKVRMLSLMRFCIRVMAHLSTKHRK